jgi:hypothetical protein
MFNDYHLDDATLGKYGLSLGQMIESAIRVQETSRSFVPRQTNIMQTILDNMARDPGNTLPIDQLLFVNIPVCDLTDLDLTYQKGLCSISSNPPAYYAYCLAYLLRDACVKYSIDGNKWPYEHDVHGF